MRTFLRELEIILAGLDDAGRERALRDVQGFVRALDALSGYLKLSGKAILALLADFTMWKSMNKPGAEIMTKAREMAKSTGPYVDRIFQAL